MTVDERIADMLARRGPDSIHARVHHQRGPHLRAAVERVEQRLFTARRTIRADRTGSLTGWLT
jgi:hypothetical protein